MISVRNFVIVACGAAVLLSIAQPANAQDGSPLDAADPNWLESYRSEIDGQVELIVAAYGLDSQQQAALRQELEIRLARQKAFEDVEMPKLQALAAAIDTENEPEDSPAAKALNDQIALIATQMPLQQESVADWVGANLVPPTVVTEGRQRWEELRFRRQAERNTTDEGLAENTTFKGDLADARTAFESVPVAETGEPLPSGEKGTRLAPTAEKKRVEHATVVPPNLTAANPDLAPKNAKQQAAKPAQLDGATSHDAAANKRPETPQAAKPTPEAPRAAEVKPQTPAEVAPPPAPPLDDWDKYVLNLAGKYSFDDAQMTNAQSILRDLKRRANQYRMSRSDAIAKAQLLTDAKAREAELKVLNRPLDAMFEELKQRLESLPTADQRSKAGATPANKARDSKK
ncbi:MAG: hypothetical protein HZA51_11895 [Planctomycetes bacterium]|nr:hypothetical protein [Planctomycetota bacterium]